MKYFFRISLAMDFYGYRTGVFVLGRFYKFACDEFLPIVP